MKPHPERGIVFTTPEFTDFKAATRADLVTMMLTSQRTSSFVRLSIAPYAGILQMWDLLSHPQRVVPNPSF